MNPDLKERTVSAKALERITPQIRAAYLESACAGDSALRQRMALKLIKPGMDTR